MHCHSPHAPQSRVLSMPPRRVLPLTTLLGAATVAPTTDRMKAAGKTCEPHVLPGAGHGFMRAQTPGPNATAAQQAWPLAVQFLKDHTKSD